MKQPSSDASEAPTRLHELTNWVLGIAGAVSLVLGMIAAHGDRTASGVTLLATGILCLLAGTIDRFEVLKGLGVEAKTRRLDQKISEANEALVRLKRITEVTARAAVDVHCRVGRWDSAPTPRTSYEFAQQIISLLRSMDVDGHAIEAAMKPWVRVFCHDLAEHLLHPLEKLAKNRLGEENHRLAAFPTPITGKEVERQKLIDNIRDLTLFIEERLRSLHTLTAEDYPERLLAIFDAAPPALDPAEVRELRDSIRPFVLQMKQIRKRFELDEPEKWFAKISEPKPG